MAQPWETDAVVKPAAKQPWEADAVISGAAPQDEESEQSKAVRDSLAKTSDDFFNKNDGVGRNLDSFVKGSQDVLLSGLADEATAGLQSLFGAIDPFAPEDADSSYASNLRRERAFQTQREAVDPVATALGRVAGGVYGAKTLTQAKAPFMAALPAKAPLLAKTGQSLAAGGLYSGLYGIGSGDGVKDRAEKGITGALTGAAIGGAIPVVAAGVKAATKPVTDAIKGYWRPEAFANQKIAERLANDLKTPTQAADEMARNPGMNLADVSGDSTKNLLKTAANVPGSAQSKIKARLNIRQMQQGDRILSQVRKTLADPDGFLSAQDDIATEAKTLAAPLFKEAEKTAIPFTKTLEDALDTPAGRRALAKAEQLAANEQKPFQQMFANIRDDGTKEIRRVPDVRGWEYIRQALDDMIEAQKDPIKKTMTNEGRILVGLQDRIFKEVRTANSAYDDGLKIWSGAHKLENALDAGRDALKKSPEANRRVLAGMSEAEKQTFRIGIADDIRNRVGDGNFTHNALLKFFSSKDKVENLKASFATDEQFKAFRKAMFAEAQKRNTYNVVTGNSSTAKQLADMADAGGLKDGVDFVQNSATGGVVSATMRWVGSRLKMLGGFTPEVADQVQRKLLTADPAMVRKITSDLMKIDAQKISADQKRQLVQRLITPVLAIPAQRSNAQ